MEKGREGREEETIDYVFRVLNKPAYIYLIGATIGIVIGCWKKDWKIGALIGYLFLILAETVLIRSPGELRYEMIPFWSWRRAFRKWSLTYFGKMMLQQILLNIVMFIPFGFLLGYKGWKAVGISAGFSVGIELIQLTTHRGLFEIDDIIHNSLGAVIGFGLYVLMRKVRGNDIR